jgi:hypothetical protein
MVTAHYHDDKQLMKTFLERFSLYDVKFDRRAKRTIRELKAVYGIMLPRYGQYGIIETELENFLSFLKHRGLTEKEYKIIIHTPLNVKNSLVELKDTAVPKSHQVEIIKFIMSPGKIKILPLQTGGGKTFCALYVIAKEQKRVSITMAAMHVHTWLNDINKFYTNADQVYVVRGKKTFVDLIKLAINGDELPPIIIFTVNTIRDYLSEYETEGKSTYGCDPSELYRTLGVSWRITDEAHQNLQFGFRHAILTNVNKILYLSATISSHTPFTNRMYECIFPIEQRYIGLEWNKYIVAVALGYMLKEPRKVKCNGAMGYSHIVFEQWIMEDHVRLSRYLEMIYKIVNLGFLEHYLTGQKMLVYAASVDMCNRIEVYLRARLLHQHNSNRIFTVHAFTGEHEDSVLHTYDIVVTTPKKAGTGKDVKGLVTVLSTVNMDAKESNIQLLGRLRVIADLYPGVDPTYYYLVCLDIPKHQQYHTRKLELFTPLVKKISSLKLQWSI